MLLLDLNKVISFPYEQRDKNVFYKTKEFKTRIIELGRNGQIPPCEMSSYVIFVVLKGDAIVTIDAKERTLTAGNCLITKPAVLSLRSDKGVRILGIQIRKERSQEEKPRSKK
jgi:quercetin dioxygenase-like cupin family protein